MQKTNSQSISNKQGEVSFRQELSKQHSSHVQISPGEPNFVENMQELKGRMRRTEQFLQDLKKRKITLSPFVEIAAGQGFRSDLLVSRFKASGFATDISQHTLATERILMKELKLSKGSIKICCDAYNLPFLSNTFPFVFIALALHHFPDPAPIINEAIRVLTPGGYFYFDEEPIEQGLNLNLWRRDFHLRWFEKILKYFVVLIWLSRIGKAEVDHGILEETFSLKTWERAMSLFQKAEVYIQVFPFSWKKTIHKKKTAGWIYPNLLIRAGLWLFGGGIGGIGQIQKSGPSRTTNNIWDMLGCPDCRNSSHLAPLRQYRNTLICTKCRHVYRKKNGVWMLLDQNMLTSLYGQKH